MKISLPKILKRVLQSIGLLFGIFILIQVSLYIYFQNNREAFQQQITELLEEEFNGNISFDNIDISFFKNFPMTSIQMNNLVITDSLYDIHKVKAIELDKVYIKVGTYSVIKGTVNVKKLTLTDGTINFFTDSSSYSNLHIFPQKEKDEGQDLQVKNLVQKTIFLTF